MNKRACLVCALALGMPALTGCQPLKVEKSVSVSPREVKSLILDPPRYDQKVTVHLSSPGAPVSAYLVLESEMTAAQDLMEKEKSPVSPLAGKDKAEDITLEATVPASKGYALLIKAEGKKAEVKVKLTGR